jgi:hypothetical protein
MLCPSDQYDMYDRQDDDNIDGSVERLPVSSHLAHGPCIRGEGQWDSEDEC